MKYDKNTVDSIVKYLKVGNTREDSHLLAGISADTFYRWMRTKPEFSETIKKAELDCKHRCLSIIQRAALTTWQAAAWWLERKMPEEYALRQRFEHSGRNGRPIEIKKVNEKLEGILDGMSGDDLLQLVKATNAPN